MGEHPERDVVFREGAEAPDGSPVVLQAFHLRPCQPSLRIDEECRDIRPPHPRKGVGGRQGLPGKECVERRVAALHGVHPVVYFLV